MVSLRWITAPLIVSIVLLSLTGGTTATGSANVGNFAFALNGYTVTGALANGIITHDGQVTMQMSVDQTIPISLGSIHITATGVWSGTTNFATLSGSIVNVKGNMHVCVSGECEDANYTGNGSWTGTLNWSRAQGFFASGTFQGELNLVNVPPAQAASISISGNWTATFST